VYSAEVILSSDQEIKRFVACILGSASRCVLMYNKMYAFDGWINTG
jgi:hypothetical protein